MKWLVQKDGELRAHEVTGQFKDAVRFAKRYSRAHRCRCTVFELPKNVRVAEVDQTGLRWQAEDWCGLVHWPTPDHPEWTRMWASLYALSGSHSDHNPASHERWQYTTTFWKRRPAIGSLLPVDVLVHEFRHRDRPADAELIPGVSRSHGRVVLHLTASHHFSGNWNYPIPEGTLV